MLMLFFCFLPRAMDVTLCRPPSLPVRSYVGKLFVVTIRGNIQTLGLLTLLVG